MAIHVLAKLLTTLYVIHMNVRIIFMIVEPTCVSKKLEIIVWSHESIATQSTNASFIVGIIKIKLLQNISAIWMYQTGHLVHMTPHMEPCASWANVSQQAVTRKLAKKQSWLQMNVEFAEAEVEVAEPSEATSNKSEFAVPWFFISRPIGTAWRHSNLMSQLHFEGHMTFDIVTFKAYSRLLTFGFSIKHSSKRRKRLISVTTIVAGAYDFDLSFVCSKCSSRKTNRYTNMLKKDIHLSKSNLPPLWLGPSGLKIEVTVRVLNSRLLISGLEFVDKKTGFVYELGHRLLDGNRIERNPDQVVIGGSLLRRKSNGKRRPPIYSIKGGLLNDIDVKIEASARGRKRTRVELDWTFKIKEGTKMPQKGEWKPQRWSKCLTQRGTRSDVSS